MDELGAFLAMHAIISPLTSLWESTLLISIFSNVSHVFLSLIFHRFHSLQLIFHMYHIPISMWTSVLHTISNFILTISSQFLCAIWFMQSKITEQNMLTKFLFSLCKSSAFQPHISQLLSIPSLRTSTIQFAFESEKNCLSSPHFLFLHVHHYSYICFSMQVWVRQVIETIFYKPIPFQSPISIF